MNLKPGPGMIFWGLLAGGALLSGLASWSLQSPLPASPPRQQGADHSFSAPRIWLFDASGQPTYEARGSLLEHRAESGDYVLTRAEMLVLPQPGAQGLWHLWAERARLADDRRHAWLEGAVTIDRDQVPPAQALRVLAQDVTLDLHERTAASEAPMQAIGEGWTSRAQRFYADFAQQLLLQEGRVHDVYESPPS